MDELQKLRDKVCKLEAAYDKEEQVRILQEIGGLLLTDYVIKIGDITVEPLWVEAYYYDEQKFPDCNTHMSEKQKNRFGQLYFHKEGRGGLDVCLSSGDYYLSFLLKATLMCEEFKKQTDIYDILEQSGRTEDSIESERNVLVRQRRDHKIMHTKRINLQKPCFNNDMLAAFALDAVSQYNFEFARESLRDRAVDYMKEYMHSNQGCSKKEYQNECRKVFGWVPDVVTRMLEDVK